MAIYLLLDGIVGDSTAPGFSGWIEIFSFSWGASNPASSSSSGAGAGKASLSDFTISKTVSRGSPLIALDCVTGKHFSGAEIADVKPSGGDTKEMTYLTYKFTDVLITSYEVSGDAGGKPSESLSLNFQKLEIEYKAQSPTGPISQDVIISREIAGA